MENAGEGTDQPDTADGQTTSPSPPPLSLPRPSDPTPPFQSSSSGRPLGHSLSAPGSMQPASTSGQYQGHLGFHGHPGPPSPAEEAAPPPHQLQSAPSHSPLPPCPSTEALPNCTHPAGGGPEEEVLPAATEEDAESDEMGNISMLPHPEELSPVQPMDQEADGCTPADATETLLGAPGQQSQESLNPLSLSPGSRPVDCAAPGNVCVIPEPDSADMECPAGCQDSVRPEEERRLSSDSIPSLAAALLELHELLVSNSRAQSHDRSTSCSPSYPFTQDAAGPHDNPAPEPRTPTPDNTRPTPSTATTAGAEPNDAKADHAAVSDEGPSKCLLPEEHLEGRGPPPGPDGSWDQRADSCGQDEASTEPAGPSALAGDPEFREHAEGQQGGGAEDGRASGADTLGLQTEHMSPMAVGSPEEVCSISPPSVPPLAQAPPSTPPAPPLFAPHPFIEQFPAEHIRRIQAAGFSATEAAEALEQAHGVVELALLALLARSITVPT